MAKKIKVIQCPQCGSTHIEQIDSDHYKCANCGAQFILDNDDVNINLNFGGQQRKADIPFDERAFEEQTPAPRNRIVKVVWIVALLAIVLAIFAAYYSESESGPDLVFASLLPQSRDARALVLENKDDEDFTRVFVFDVLTGKPLATTQIKERLSERGEGCSGSFFSSDSTYYLIGGGKYIYKFDPVKLCLDNVTDSICARKVALNAGLKKVEFINSLLGEGFVMNTKLGKTLYYFPASDLLCTKEALQVMATTEKGILPGARNMRYYIFENNDKTSYASNVSRLVEVDYLFNNGGPQLRLNSVKPNEKLDPGLRITSLKAITPEWPCIKPKVQYYDDQYILVSFIPTADPKDPLVVRLFDTEGNQIFSYTPVREIKSVVRTKNGFMIQTKNQMFEELSGPGQNVRSKTYELFKKD